MLLLQLNRLASRTNPPRPAELQAVYDQVGRWAKASMDWLTENAKMDKPVAGQHWFVRGISLLSSKSLANMVAGIKRRTGHDPAAEREFLTRWGLTPEEAKRLRSVNVCPGASAGCEAVCLVDSGQMGLPASRDAQIKRTLLFALKEYRPALLTLYAVAIAALRKSCGTPKVRKAGQKPRRELLGIRLNVTSDVLWEAANMQLDVQPWLADYLNRQYGVGDSRLAPRYPAALRERMAFRTQAVRPGKQTLLELFPDVLFYDYTKITARMERFRRWRFDPRSEPAWPSNYWLTWSYSEDPAHQAMAVKVLAEGISSVSMPFNRLPARAKRVAEPLPSEVTFLSGGVPVGTFPVIDADKHDVRPLDPPGSIAGLHVKTSKGAERDMQAGVSSGFVVSGSGDHVRVEIGRTNPPPKGAQWFGAMRDVMLEIRRRKAAASTQKNPLQRGWARSTIGANIRELLRAGRPRAQAIAIALSTARRSAGCRRVRYLRRR